MNKKIIKGTKFIALADYNAMGNSEVSLKEGATVELRKLGCAGWVFVKKLGNFYGLIHISLCLLSVNN